MDAYRLRIKLGSAEFEAEGREELVLRQFEEFKSLLEKSGRGPLLGADDTPQAPPNLGAKAASLGKLQLLYNLEDRNGGPLLTLRSPAEQVQSSLLLLLLGYRRLGMNEVPGTLLKKALERSGVSLARLDRAAAPLEKENVVRRTGTKKASRYWLTNVGITRAETDATKMLDIVS